MQGEHARLTTHQVGQANHPRALSTPLEESIVTKTRSTLLSTELTGLEWYPQHCQAQIALENMWLMFRFTLLDAFGRRKSPRSPLMTRGTNRTSGVELAVSLKCYNTDST